MFSLSSSNDSRAIPFCRNERANKRETIDREEEGQRVGKGREREREPPRHLPWESVASSGIQPRSELLQAGFTLEYKADASTLGER